MRPIALLTVLSPVVIVLAGCVSEATTRFPHFLSQHPAVEKRAFQIYDPLPDSNLGPDMEIRPLEFNRQRTESRRLRDVQNALELGRQLNPQTQPTPQMPLGSKYPNVVRP